MPPRRAPPRERAAGGVVELDGCWFVGSGRRRVAVPGTAVGITLDRGQRAMGCPPRILRLGVVDDRPDQRVAKLHVPRRQLHEAVELGGREVAHVEPVPMERLGDRVTDVRAGCGRDEQRGPRSLRQSRDTGPECPLDATVHGHRLTERILATKLRV